MRSTLPAMCFNWNPSELAPMVRQICDGSRPAVCLARSSRTWAKLKNTGITKEWTPGSGPRSQGSGSGGSLFTLTHVSGVAERIAAGLGIDAHPVGPIAHSNARAQSAIGRIEDVHLAVVAARKPKQLAIRRNAAHIRTAAARD